ncbi:MAG: dihydrofolate reductase [Flavobacteriaceae bacterium]|jgi:dihydrofolate reductase|nr:dihydrofolate reductase [Flavobacteriaceae bacterium]
MIIMIAAAAENNALGKNNELVWHLPNDFKRFKNLTSGHHIIMGRKTFESFPRPLPNRTHVIITRSKDYAPEGCIIVNSMEEAIAACPQEEDVFIIGGGEIYQLGMPFTDKIELTLVHHSFEADTFFPTIDEEKWTLQQSEKQLKDDKHQFDYTYQTFVIK